MEALTIGEQEILTRTTRYQLERGDGRLFIDVHEIIAGDASAQFIAVPNLILRDADPKYFGEGASEREALSNCLRLISGVPTNDVIAKVQGG